MHNSLKIFNKVSRSLRYSKNKLFHKWTNDFVRYSEEVMESFIKRAPIVALESTVITHGLPYPDNLRTAIQMEEIVRKNKAIPATIGVIDGIVHIGMDTNKLEILASKNKETIKISRRDLPYIISKGMSGGTTVAATMILAHRAGISIFATGGIGGVHRGGENTMDISADLFELSRTPMTVVSAGVKSILDIGRTLEYLETMGVCVASFGPSKVFPSFFTPDSKYSAACHVETYEEAAHLIDSRDRLELSSGILLAVPIPEEYHKDGYKTEAVIEEALRDARNKGISGKQVTPFVLSRVRELSEGASLKANIGLLENNAKVGSQIAVHLNHLKNSREGTSSPRVLQSPVRSVDKKCLSTSGRPVVIGGSVLDIHVKALEDVKMDGRTLKGKVESNAGGVGRNLADCMSRLDTNPFFISTVGAQEHAQALLSKMDHMDKSGIKLVANSRTAVCIVVLDQYGECLHVIGDMNIHECITAEIVEEHKKMICGAPLVVMDGNIPEETIQHILSLCSENNVPVWFEPTDLSKAFRPFKPSSLWRSSIAYASPNLNELRVIYNTLLDKDVPLSFGMEGHLNNILEEALCLGIPLLDGSLHTLAVTLGSRGVLVISNVQSPFPIGQTIVEKGKVRAVHYPALTPPSVVSVSGAGDCFASGMMSAILRGLHQDDCVKIGQRAAILSLSSHHAVPETVCAESVFCAHESSLEKEPLVLL